MGVSVKRISSTERLTNTASGNPRWRVVWTDGTSNLSKPDSDLAFRLDSAELADKDLRVVIGKGGFIEIATPL